MGEVVKFKNFDDTVPTKEDDLSSFKNGQSIVIKQGENLVQHVVPSSVYKKIFFGELEGKEESYRIRYKTKTLPQSQDGETMDEGYKQYIKRLDEDAREREARLHSEMKEREERYEKRSKEVEDRLISLYSDSIKKIEDKLDAHEKIIEGKLNLMESKISNIENQVGEIHNRTRFWVNLLVPAAIALIVGVVTVFVTLYASGKL
ncbi:hypothetical protein LC085_07710 [Bacillus tianshenii]|uniref:hypothetical protein n=1 Tax=Sutcliffiella tianshenii TaxID=1463404 RepID=UPI001CD5A3AD|nr:hypothetical protein [Bacillus tianshenii]MCA1319798.1 hypothetical protein [Bacillus tianshenii]